MNTTTASSAPATRRGVTEQAAIAAIDSATRVLRLPTIRGRFEEVAAAAQREQLTYLGFLAELVMAECDDRTATAPPAESTTPGFRATSGSTSSTSPPTPRSARR